MPARHIADSSDNDASNHNNDNNEGRFEIIYKQDGIIDDLSIACMIIKDKQAGNEYLYVKHWGVGGIVPLQK